MELRKFVVSEFVFGDKALQLAGRYAANFGINKALIVTDPGIREAGWVEHIEKSLKLEGIDYLIFDSVTPNPKDYEVMKGAEVFLKNNCNVIIAIGGGSPIDCAKGIGIVSTNSKHITKFEGVDEVKIPMPPLICIPTTAGTAADISQFAIITHSKENRKIAIISKAVVPDISLIDATTTTTMSNELSAATGMDALVHAIEAYVSNASSPVTDIHSLEAIRLISNNLSNAIKEPENLIFRNNMMLGSLYAGMAFSNASLGIVHAMAHSLGGLKDSPHGECNAILLEHSIELNIGNAFDKYSNILDAMGGNSNELSIYQVKDSLKNRIVNFRNSIGINFTLSQIGIKKTDLRKLAENAINDACLATNPVDVTVEQIEAIYECIL